MAWILTTNPTIAPDQIVIISLVQEYRRREKMYQIVFYYVFVGFFFILLLKLKCEGLSSIARLFFITDSHLVGFFFSLRWVGRVRMDVLRFMRILLVLFWLLFAMIALDSLAVIAHGFSAMIEVKFVCEFHVKTIQFSICLTMIIYHCS